MITLCVHVEFQVNFGQSELLLNFAWYVSPKDLMVIVETMNFETIAMAWADV